MTNTTSSLRNAFNTAFSDGIYLPGLSQRDAFRGKYRNAFAFPFQYIQDGRKSWPGIFDELDIILYDSTKGVGSALKADFEERLTQYDIILKKVDGVLDIYARYSESSKSLTELQRHVMDSFTTVSNFSTMLDDELAKFENCVRTFQEGDIDKILKDVQDHWGNFASAAASQWMPKPQGVLPQDVDFFPYLSDWAIVSSKLERTAFVFNKIRGKLPQIVQHLNLLSKTLQSMSLLSLDILGNSGAGAQIDVESDLAEEFNLVQQLGLWRQNQPVLREQEIAMKHVMRGEVAYERNGQLKRGGDDLSQAKGLPLVIDSIMRLDVGVSQDIWISKETDGMSNRYWKPQGATEFYSSTLGWVEMPEAVRSRVRYGEAELDLHGGRTVEWLNFSDIYNTTEFDVKFDKPFETDSVALYTWIQAFDIGRTSRELSLKVDLPPGRRADRNGFKACITVPRGSLKYVRFAYIAYEYRQDVDFRLSTYEQRGKYKRPGTTRCEFFSYYYSYGGSDLNLKSAPAVLVMLKNFRFDRNHNIRLEVQHVATKAGVIVRAQTWWDSEMKELDYVILTIADRLE